MEGFQKVWARAVLDFLVVAQIMPPTSPSLGMLSRLKGAPTSMLLRLWWKDSPQHPTSAGSHPAQFLTTRETPAECVVWSGNLDQCCRLPAKRFTDQGQSRSFLDIPAPANQHRPPLSRGVQLPAAEAEVRSVPAETHPSQLPRPPLGWVISLVPLPPPLLRRLPPLLTPPSPFPSHQGKFPSPLSLPYSPAPPSLLPAQAAYTFNHTPFLFAIWQGTVSGTRCVSNCQFNLFLRIGSQ
jgi:hypothetical protein